MYRINEERLTKAIRNSLKKFLKEDKEFNDEFEDEGFKDEWDGDLPEEGDWYWSEEEEYNDHGYYEDELQEIADEVSVVNEIVMYYDLNTQSLLFDGKSVKKQPYVIPILVYPIVTPYWENDDDDEPSFKFDGKLGVDLCDYECDEESLEKLYDENERVIQNAVNQIQDEIVERIKTKNPRGGITW